MSAAPKRRRGDGTEAASRRSPSAVAYAGFSPKSDWLVAHLTTLPTASDFYSRFVSQRQPVVIDGLPTDESFDIGAWAPRPLFKRCAKAQVYIEQRSPAGSFGTGRKELMSFASFAAQLARREDLYLTTQPVEEDPETGLPAQLYASPITEMRSCLPLRPALAGNLVVSSVNLWLGRSAVGTSSNLHHDHHDNIYLALRGRKRFTLFPPSAGFRMYLHGPLSFVHRNGVLNYAGCATRDDGAMPHLALQWLRSRKASAGTSTGAGSGAAAGKGGGGKRGSAAQIAAAEADLAAAMARDPEYAAAVQDDAGSDSGAASGSDDADDSDAVLSDASFDEDDDDDDSGDDSGDGMRAPTAGAKGKTVPKAANGSGGKKSSAASAAAEADAMWAALSAVAAPSAKGSQGSGAKGSKPTAAKASAEADAMWAALSAEVAGSSRLKPKAKPSAGASVAADASKVKVKSSGKGSGKGSGKEAGKDKAAKSSEADDMWAALEAHAATTSASASASAAVSKTAASNSSAPAAASSAASKVAAPVPVHFSRISMPELRQQLRAEDSSSKGKASAGATSSASETASVGSKRRAAADASGAVPGSDASSSSSSSCEVSRMRRLPEVTSRFPLFADEAGAPSCTFELRAGQMLFLPAGWFHEVVSLGADDGDDGDDGDDHDGATKHGSGGASGGAGAALSASAGATDLTETAALEGLRRSHMALNYWFYPPSSAPGVSFEQPYVDGYWSAVYEGMLKRTPGASDAGLALKSDAAAATAAGGSATGASTAGKPAARKGTSKATSR